MSCASYKNMYMKATDSMLTSFYYLMLSKSWVTNVISIHDSDDLTLCLQCNFLYQSLINLKQILTKNVKWVVHRTNVEIIRENRKLDFEEFALFDDDMTCMASFWDVLVFWNIK